MKFPDSAHIVVPDNDTALKLKIAGLYTTERNILLLAESGFKKIYIAPGLDKLPYLKKLLKKAQGKYKNCSFILQDPPKAEKILRITANVFLQAYQFQAPETYFAFEKNSTYVPQHEEIFTITSLSDARSATKEISKKIIANTGGVIAQKLNKRISIPISRVLSKTPIHPNIITLVNLLVGVASAYFIFLSADLSLSYKERYLMMVMGGFIFQLASVLDGVDGEVAKFTFRTSRLGGWLDTAVDNLTLLFFLAAATHVNYHYLGGISTTISAIILFISVTIILGMLFIYTKKHSDTESLTSFDKEFLQKLPPKDPVIKFSIAMKYVIKKEFFSLGYFIVCLMGLAHIILPVSAFVGLCSAGIILLIYFKYKNRINIINKGKTAGQQK